MDERVTLKSLINIDSWQKLQDDFAAIAHTHLRTLDENGDPITSPSGTSALCQISKDSSVGKELCGDCLPTFLGGQERLGRNLSFICHLSLYTFIAPLKLEENTILGYLTVGPFILVSRKPKQEYAIHAEKLGVSLDTFWNALQEVKVISFTRALMIIQLIKDFGEYILGLAYRKTSLEQQLQEISPDNIAKLRVILKGFLDMAVQVSGADVGSIMVIQPQNNELAILAAKGLPDDIVNNTRVPLGNGISGIAAQENRAFLINESSHQDNRILPYLNRPYLGSSMVLPIKIQDKVIGVINLGTLSISQVKFDSRNVEGINRLIELADASLEIPSR